MEHCRSSSYRFSHEIQACSVWRRKSLQKENTNRTKAAGAINQPTLKKVNAENPRIKMAPRANAVHLSSSLLRTPIITKSATTTPRAPIRACMTPIRLASSHQSAQPMPNAAKRTAQPTTKLATIPGLFIVLPYPRPAPVAAPVTASTEALIRLSLEPSSQNRTVQISPRR